MSDRDDREKARRALAEPLDFTGAVVDTQPPRAKVVQSVRLDPELSEQLEAEAARRGVRPSALVREFVAQGLAAAASEATVTVRLADLHRAIDAAVYRAA